MAGRSRGCGSGGAEKCACAEVDDAPEEAEEGGDEERTRAEERRWSEGRRNWEPIVKRAWLWAWPRAGEIFRAATREMLPLKTSWKGWTEWMLKHKPHIDEQK